jgi:hypothetical protein
MPVLLRQFDLLRRLVTHPHFETAPRGRDRQVAIAEASDQVEGLSRRLLECEAHRVVRDVALDRRAHVRRRAEESVRGHQAVQRLMRSLEVVCVHVECDAPLAVREVREHRP